MSTAPRREPLLRVVSRPEKSPRQVLLLRLESVLLSLAAGGVFILLIGYNPFEIYATILSGAFRSRMAVQATVKYAIPLVIASLGVTLAFRMRFWNIGAEGQVLIGGLATAACSPPISPSSTRGGTTGFSSPSCFWPGRWAAASGG